MHRELRPVRFRRDLPSMPAASQETSASAAMRRRTRKRMPSPVASRSKASRNRSAARSWSCSARATSLINASEGERLARAASGPTELVVFKEGNTSASISATSPATDGRLDGRTVSWVNSGRQGRAVASPPLAEAWAGEENSRVPIARDQGDGTYCVAASTRTASARRTTRRKSIRSHAAERLQKALAALKRHNMATALSSVPPSRKVSNQPR